MYALLPSLHIPCGLLAEGCEHRWLEGVSTCQQQEVTAAITLAGGLGALAACLLPPVIHCLVHRVWIGGTLAALAGHTAPRAVAVILGLGRCLEEGHLNKQSTFGRCMLLHSTARQPDVRHMLSAGWQVPWLQAALIARVRREL